MKKSYNNTDPEKLVFRSALDSIAIEPSERFWNSALDNIIDKGNALNKGQIKAWKGISLVLAIAFVFTGIHEIVMYNKVNKIETQISEIKTKQLKLIENENNINSVGNRMSNQVTNTGRNLPVQSQIQKIAINSPSVNRQNKNQKYDVASHTLQNSLIISGNRSQSFSLAGEEKQSIIRQESSDNSGVNYKSAITGAISRDKELSSNTTSSSNNDSSNLSMQKASLSILNNSTVDSVDLLSAYQKPKPSFSLKHKASISAFFAPGITTDFLKDKDNETEDNLSVNDIKARQSDVFAYDAGIKLGFDISRKLTLYSGLYYNLYSYNIKQTIVVAKHEENGSIGYSIVTSSGMVDIPYNGMTPKIGDSIKVHGNSTRGYICIPLQLSFSIVAHNRFKFYAIGGVSADIATYQGVEIDWQNTALQDGNASVQSVQGLDRIHYSYNLGLGFRYALGKGFSVYAEPLSLRGAITSINTNAPIATYPYFFSSNFGLTYHL